MKAVEEIKDKLVILHQEFEWLIRLYAGKKISKEELLKNLDKILIQKDILNWVLRGS